MLSHGGPLTESWLWRFIKGVVPETDRAFSERMNDRSDHPNEAANLPLGCDERSTPFTEGRDSPLLPVSGRSLFRRADRTELDLCASRSSRRTTRCEMLSGGRQGDGKHRRCS